MDHDVYRADDSRPRDRGSPGQIGEDAIEEIGRFFGEVYGGHDLRWTPPVFAPSIITRSDAEFYDVSYPRWACRYHLKLVNGSTHYYAGFVNVRRLEVLRGAVRERSSGLLSSMPPIADALLRYPPQLREPWADRASRGEVELCLLETDLGPEYGELSFPGALPYVKPDTSLGGVCAHGCLVMTTLLTRSLGARVFGLADIAAILGASQVGKGLSLFEDMKFLCDDRVGMGAFLHVFQNPDEASVGEDIAATLCGYLRSGIPVLVSVDAVKTGLVEPSKGDKDYKHLVLLVGFARDRGSGATEFVVQDTLTRPFRRLSLDTLIRGRAGKRLRFLVPVPKGVNLPLGSWLDVREDEPPLRLGLLEHTDLLLGNMPVAEKPDWSCSCPSFGRERATGLRHVLVSRKQFLYRYVSLNDGRHARITDLFGRRSRRLPDWIWVQEWRDAEDSLRGIWCWNAGQNKAIGYPQFIIGCGRPGYVGLRGAGIRLGPGNSFMKSGLPSLATPREPPLRVSLLSSYSPHVQLRRLMCEASEHSVHALDLYCFTQDHLRAFSAVNQRVGRETSLEVEDCLAAWLATSKMDACQAIADSIARTHRRATKRTGCRLVIPAFATYMPKISDGRQARATTVDAIRALVRIARHLRDPGRLGQDGPSVIEIVAGNVWSGRLKSVDAPESSAKWEVELAGCDPDPRKRRNSLIRKIRSLLGGLREVIDGEDLNNESLGQITLAIELEPGALSVVQNLDSLTRLAAALNNDPDRFACVGFNLDIGHYHLAGIRPDEIRKRPIIFERIAHSHISDFGPGHLADLVPGVIHSSEDFSRWLELLGETACVPQAYRRAHKLPPFSGFVTAEMEACREPRQAFAAYHRTKAMVQRCGLG